MARQAETGTDMARQAETGTDITKQTETIGTDMARQAEKNQRKIRRNQQFSPSLQPLNYYSQWV